MTMYNAAVEVATRQATTEAALDAAMERLSPFHASVGVGPRGWASARISLLGETLAQAAAAAVALVEAAFDGAPALVAEVMTEAEFDIREGWQTLPELVSVTEVAQLLGVSRQRVLQRIEAKTLPATRVGRDWVIARAALGGAEV